MLYPFSRLLQLAFEPADLLCTFSRRLLLLALIPQLALEFISPEIAPSRLVTPYVAGWFEKPGGKLYVNRGIGTIFVPIRVGAPPEITVYELARG